ncbi:hypothetical protein IE53DRAFT_320134 [Violaceomyces palustris]|uniref:Uncharacterized protein n=1 Tax=Violaceomyces palustris TaxID=1673888 RepID=A0ACD0NQC5_9BASI|nr:hypothetical protein IE53DRAFT_320134 [Violaceomyces palustris]
MGQDQQDDALHGREEGEVGELHRRMKARHISMIAIGGALSTGLLIGTGTGLSVGGPVSLLIAFCVVGVCCTAVMFALGEMGTFIPHARGFAGHASMFVSPEFGFALGYNYLFKYLVATAVQLNASALIISYWNQEISGGVWISVIIVFILLINFFGPRAFGEIEFWLGAIKITTITGLIILMIVIDLGGGPNRDRIGFRNWKSGKAFKEYKAEGDLGRFLGFWSVMISALFAYTGTELVGVTIGEAKDPRKSFPSAVRKTLFRIVFFYIFSVFMVGLVVPSDHPLLLSATKSKTSATASPFVVAVKIAGIEVLPSIINAVLLIIVISAANSDQYIASRTLYGLAIEGKAPRIFTRVNRFGVPYVALCFTACFCSLAYINLAEGGSKSFNYLVASGTIFAGIAWIAILITHIRFRMALKLLRAEGSTAAGAGGEKGQQAVEYHLPWTSPGGMWLSVVSLFWTSLVILFKSWTAFVPWNWRTFVTGYIGLPVFLLLMVIYKLVMKTKIVKLSDVDFSAGKFLKDLQQ